METKEIELPGENVGILAALGTDAAKWSKALADRLSEMQPKNSVYDDDPGSDLFAWVANMIEAGRSAGYAEGQRDLSEAVELSAFVSDFAVAPTVALDTVAASVKEATAMINAAVQLHGFALIPSTDDVYVARSSHIVGLVAASMRIAAMRIPDMAAPAEGMSLTDYVSSIQPGAYKLNALAVGALLQRAHDEGAAISRASGLNDKGEYPAIVLEQSNAVVVYVTSIGDHRVHVDVDGRNRLTVEGAELVTLIDNGNRTVLRSPNMAGPDEPEPEPVKTPVFSDEPSVNEMGDATRDLKLN